MSGERPRLPLAALLGAQGISVTGNRIAQLAIPWFVLQTTGSASSTGIAVAMNTVPAIIAGLFAGPLIERVGFRTTSIAADVASGATIATIPLLHLAGVLDYPVLLVLVFLGALLDAPGDTGAGRCCPTSPSTVACRSTGRRACTRRPTGPRSCSGHRWAGRSSPSRAPRRRWPWTPSRSSSPPCWSGWSHGPGSRPWRGPTTRCRAATCATSPRLGGSCSATGCCGAP